MVGSGNRWEEHSFFERILWEPTLSKEGKRCKTTKGGEGMIWLLLVIGFLLLLPLFFKTIAFTLRVVFAVIGPLLIVVVVVLLLLGIIF